MTPATFYIGFGSLEQLLNTHQPGQPLYFDLVLEPAGGSPVTTRTYVLIISDVQDVVCRYWRKTLARTAFIGDQEFKPGEYNDHVRRAEGAKLIVERMLHEVYKMQPQPAVPAIPRDLRLLDGETDCLRFDAGARQWVAA